MKIDYPYIESVKTELESGEIDKKTAKQLLVDYAKESFNFTLNKQKTIDNMIVQLEDYIANYKEEPLPETTGFTITDLIEATDQIEGKSVFNEASQEALDLVTQDSLDQPGQVIDEDLVKPIVDKTDAVTDVVSLNKTDSELPVETSSVVNTDQISSLDQPGQVIDEDLVKPTSTDYVLPVDFTPTIMMIGKAPGYYTLPWWIYKWILENEDWKSKPESCPEHSAINILKSLIYFINKDGQVRIRETRNSSFVDLS